ncbi:MAG: glycosyltransferase family 1 protein [Kofleriaceae bacterium]
MPDAESVLCLSHLRWNFVFQRPQHLLSRCAQQRRLVFFEEPIFDATSPDLELRREGRVVVAVPHLPGGMAEAEVESAQRTMVDHVISRELEPRPVLWFYTPMALGFTHHVRAKAIVYDCMDELSLFKGAPPALAIRERMLLDAADVVFTGGHSLYEHKRLWSGHRNIYPFPSSVDVPHFAQARELLPDPLDQAEIPHPRVGFFGVIDERMDLALLDKLASNRPDVHFVMIGPVVKIDPATLPRHANIHYLGQKSYDQLPAYLAGWDVAMMPFALNDSTRFISPTKTPEYLAAGKPVVSSAITDVVKPYGVEGLAWIADTVHEWSAAIDTALAADRTALRAHADDFLSELSWDRTWREMWGHVERAITSRASLYRSGLHAAGSAAHALNQEQK